MGEITGISWTRSTFNPWQGCTKIGPGCDHCYAESADQRFHKGTHWGAGAPRKTMSESTWNNPLRWNREAAKTGEFWPVFCASPADVFDNEADPALRARLFKLIRSTPHLTWQLLTKRIGNVIDMLPDDWGAGYPNVWLGATFVNQDELNRDYRKLVATQAVKRFASNEPMLGAINLKRIDVGNLKEIDALTAAEYLTGGEKLKLVKNWPALDWVIAGGESGANARPSHPDWFRGLRDQCHERGIPYFFKQWGGYWEIAHETTDEYCEAVQLDADDPDDAKLFKKSRDKLITIDGRVFDSLDDIPDDTRCRHVTRISTKAAGNILDGRQHLAFPDGLSFSAASPANTRQSIQFHPFV